VGHLADCIAGGGARALAWPVNDKPLAATERTELQKLLAARGHDTGGIDGVIGDQTRAAIRAMQRDLSLAEDGYPNFDLLLKLRSTTP
jgi:membrane-bound lytic murein transglycosylase B